MIYFFTPYSLNKNLFEGYDTYANLVTNENDYLVFMDGDILFFQSNFGHLVEKAINDNPNFGLLTCFTNRVGGTGRLDQVYSDKCFLIDSMRFHSELAMELEQNNTGKYSKLGNKIGGLFMVIQKKTWNLIRESVSKQCANRNLLGVDYIISEAIAIKNLPIYRIDNLYVFHFYRLNVEGSAVRRGLK